MKIRRPVQMVTQGDRVVVVCDDGTVWLSEDVKRGPWVEARPIPGTEADAEDKN